MVEQEEELEDLHSHKITGKYQYDVSCRRQEMASNEPAETDLLSSGKVKYQCH